jgi:hypothetical protein
MPYGGVIHVWAPHLGGRAGGVGVDVHETAGTHPSAAEPNPNAYAVRGGVLVCRCAFGRGRS